MQDFLKKVNARVDGYNYRLPTEAEWEYAARSGTQGDAVDALDARAWYENNSGNEPHPVGRKQPNPWGLYDMQGNVWEWCQDWAGDYPAKALIDPQGPASGQFRVLRGGAWFNGAASLRVPSRLWNRPEDKGFGFRCVREVR